MKDIQGFKDLREHYSKEEIAKSYESLRFSNLAGKIEHKITINVLNSIIKKEQPELLLEIATGPGRITKYINLPNKGIGVDTSENMLRLARKNVSNKNWKFLKVDINKMPFKKNHFDMIITFRLLIHFTDKQRKNSYVKIKKILKNKGTFIFDIGNKNYKKPSFIKNLLKFYRILKKEEKNKLLPGIYNNPSTLDNIVKELKENKFKINKIYGVNYYNWFVLSLLSLSKRLRFSSNIIENIILNFEKSKQSNLKNYATFIIMAENEKN